MLDKNPRVHDHRNATSLAHLSARESDEYSQSYGDPGAPTDIPLYEYSAHIAKTIHCMGRSVDFS